MRAPRVGCVIRRPPRCAFAVNLARQLRHVPQKNASSPRPRSRPAQEPQPEHRVRSDYDRVELVPRAARRLSSRPIHAELSGPAVARVSRHVPRPAVGSRSPGRSCESIRPVRGLPRVLAARTQVESRAPRRRQPPHKGITSGRPRCINPSSHHWLGSISPYERPARRGADGNNKGQAGAHPDSYSRTNYQWAAGRYRVHPRAVVEHIHLLPSSQPLPQTSRRMAAAGLSPLLPTDRMADLGACRA